MLRFCWNPKQNKFIGHQVHSFFSWEGGNYKMLMSNCAVRKGFELMLCIHYFEIVYSHSFVLYLCFFSGLMLIWRTNLGGPNSWRVQLHPLDDDWRHRGRTSFLQVFSCWWTMSFRKSDRCIIAWDNNYLCLLVSNESHIRHSECFDRYLPMSFCWNANDVSHPINSCSYALKHVVLLL